MLSQHGSEWVPCVITYFLMNLFLPLRLFNRTQLSYNLYQWLNCKSSARRMNSCAGPAAAGLLHQQLPLITDQ